MTTAPIRARCCKCQQQPMQAASTKMAGLALGRRSPATLCTRRSVPGNAADCGRDRVGGMPRNKGVPLSPAQRRIIIIWRHTLSVAALCCALLAILQAWVGAGTRS